MNTIKTKLNPLVTICMVVYNADKWISQTLISVLTQTYQNYELLIIDDGSTDHTAMIVKSFRENMILKDKARYIYQDHKNFASGLNRGIAEAKGEYILGLDADDFIAPEYLESMVKEAVKLPNKNYFYPALLVVVGEYGEIKGVQYHINFSDKSTLRDFMVKEERSPIPRPGSLIRKSLFEKVGVYEELETCEDFVFLCKNMQEIEFWMIFDVSEYFYRNRATSNSRGKPEARDTAHKRGLSYLEEKK